MFAERYRSRARECAALAERATDLFARQYFLQLARVWDDLAERAERQMSAQESPADLSPDTARPGS